MILCNDNWPRSNTRGFRTDLFDGVHWAVIVEDGASIGANATVLPGVKLGKNCMIAAGAVVSCDVPAYHLYVSKNNIRRISISHPIRMKIITDE